MWVDDAPHFFQRTFTIGNGSGEDSHLESEGALWLLISGVP